MDIDRQADDRWRSTNPRVLAFLLKSLGLKSKVTVAETATIGVHDKIIKSTQ